MKNNPEMVFEIGAEGGGLRAYCIKDEADHYSFYFETNELDMDLEPGPTRRSNELITDFNELLLKIRSKYREIYNLAPGYVHPDYTKKVLYDLRFRIKDDYFDLRDWASVLFLGGRTFWASNLTEKEIHEAEKKLQKYLDQLDQLHPDIKEERIINEELEKIRRFESDLVYEYMMGFDESISNAEKIIILSRKHNMSEFEIEQIILDELRKKPETPIDVLTDERVYIDPEILNDLENLPEEELDMLYKDIAEIEPDKKKDILTRIENIVIDRLKRREESSLKIANSLGAIHNKYKLFSSEDFQIPKEKNIIHALDEFPYLQNFYNYYIANFEHNESNVINRTEAKNTDLPYIGKQAIVNGKIDFMFYFEGSRQVVDKISITVLAHLWTTYDQKIIDRFCGKDKWWTEANFRNIRNRLSIKKHVVDRSYITDAVRFEQDDESSKLIHEEIAYFKPKIVICVGTKARDLVGMRYYDFPVQFHYVKFPKYHKEDDIYVDLNKILDTL